MCPWIGVLGVLQAFRASAERRLGGEALRDAATAPKWGDNAEKVRVWDGVTLIGPSPTGDRHVGIPATGLAGGQTRSWACA